MEITYNIKAVYIYHDEGKTKVHSFSGKVNRSVWEYALSTPDFRSFLEAKSRECFDTISRMNQTLRDVVVVFHISFQDNIPFVESVVCFFRTVSRGELRCRYDLPIRFEETLPAGEYLRNRFIEGMIQKERPGNSAFRLLLFAVSIFSVFGILTVPFFRLLLLAVSIFSVFGILAVPLAFNLELSPFVRTGMAVITVLILLTACLTDINRRRITRRMEIQDKKTGNH